jgi:hypothetical protein
MMFMVRIKVGPKVDRDLYEEFKQLVKNRYGQTRGVLGIELDNALKNHIDQLRTRVTTTDNQPVTDQASMIEEEPSTHTHSQSSLFPELMVNFRNKYQNVLEISKKDLRHFIRETENVKDSRPIKNRVDYLEGIKWIEPIIDRDGIYRNLLASELSQDTRIIKENSYNQVSSYFQQKLNGNMIEKNKIRELPEDIQKSLFALDKDEFDEFVK